MIITFGTSIVIQAFTWVVIAVLPINVTTTTGETISGKFAGINDSSLSVDVDGKMQTMAFDDLHEVVPMTPDTETTGPTMRVSLVGGSIIAAESDLSLTGDTLTIQPRRQPKILVPIKEVRWIRFRAASPTTDPQWLGMLDEEKRGDLMAIHRDSGQLDPQPGIVEQIAGGKVKFDLEGDTVDAPIERLEGVIFGAADATDSATKIKVVDKNGSRWSVIAFSASEADAALQLKLSDSISHQLPLDHLQSISWSGGLSLLASTPPAEFDHTLYVDSKLPNAKIWFGPQSQGDDIVMNGGTTVEFRVEDGFRELSGSVRRDSTVAKAGDVSLQILVDGKEQWKETLTNTDLRGFAIDVTDASRVRFVIDSGDDGDLGDRVLLKRPRLLK